MKDVPITIKEPDVLEKKVHRLQKRMSLMFWTGWATGYTNAKKK